MPPPDMRRVGSRQGRPSELATTLSLAPVADNPLDALARHVDGAFVLVVQTTGGKYRRRCFLSVKSAERAARNATAAGHNAKVYLAQLKPLWRLEGHEEVAS